MGVRRLKADGPFFIFTYYWSGRWPVTYEFDLSGSGCHQTVGWDRISDIHTLDRGNLKGYSKGWRVHAELNWTEGLIRREYWDTDTYEGRTEKILQLLYSTGCNNSIFYFPSPGVHPSKYYDVMVSGDYNFSYIRGLEGVGLTGSMTLIGKEVYDEIPWRT